MANERPLETSGRDQARERNRSDTPLISAPFNVAWAAAITDALDLRDVELPLKYIVGFEVVFDVPDSTCFRPNEQPATISKQEFLANNTRMVTSISDEIRNSATLGSGDEKERRRTCWERTKEEIAAGLVSEPFTRAQMDKRRGRGLWRCIGRNGIIQKGKVRCIDNAKRSKHDQAA